ncbi:hypothetical protein R3P38DRAFT_3380909 [Favolaschia claudopus]|uniref:F-box domain-containing protein n=1 Tax=Favolaschia claudopus TaxID=2862362 RepID=A0AAV9Z0M2_9AGAR
MRSSSVVDEQVHRQNSQVDSAECGAIGSIDLGSLDDNLVEKEALSGCTLQIDCFIFRLPPEIVSEIFVAFYDPFLERKLTAEATWGHNFPLVLTQICSTWRTVALDTPPLWSFASIVLSKPPPHGIETKTRLITHYLARGRRENLSLHLILHHSFPVSNPSGFATTLEPIRSLLVTFARDWRRIVVEATYPSRHIIGSFAGTLLQCPCPSLVELEFAVPSIDIILPASSIRNIGGENLLPRLRSFRLLSHMQRDVDPDPPVLALLPLHQLSIFSYTDSLPSTKWFAILKGLSHSSSVKLAVLKVQMVIDALLDDSITHNTITLPNLSRLHLVLDNSRSLHVDNNLNIDAAFLRLLHLPRLAEFQLAGVTSSSLNSSSITWDTRHSTFFTHHAAQLRKLILGWGVKVVLRSTNDSSASYTDCFFRPLTSLTTLAIERSGILLRSHDIETLRTGGLILPSLTHFTFKLFGARTQTIDAMRAVISLLEARRKPSFPFARLLCVKVYDHTRSYGPRPSGPSFSTLSSMKSEWERLCALKAEGMEVEWLPVMSEFRGDLVGLWMMRKREVDEVHSNNETFALKSPPSEAKPVSR